jgi:hypothetical protein
VEFAIRGWNSRLCFSFVNLNLGINKGLLGTEQLLLLNCSRQATAGIIDCSRCWASIQDTVWDELKAVAEQLNLNEDSYALVWGYEKSGVYSSHSCYAVISYRGVTPIYIPATWNIVVPLKIQLFFVAFSHNKLATVYNLNKKRFE